MWGTAVGLGGRGNPYAVRRNPLISDSRMRLSQINEDGRGADASKKDSETFGLDRLSSISVQDDWRVRLATMQDRLACYTGRVVVGE